MTAELIAGHVSSMATTVDASRTLDRPERNVNSVLLALDAGGLLLGGTAPGGPGVTATTTASDAPLLLAGGPPATAVETAELLLVRPPLGPPLGAVALPSQLLLLAGLPVRRAVSSAHACCSVRCGLVDWPPTVVELLLKPWVPPLGATVLPSLLLLPLALAGLLS